MAGAASPSSPSKWQNQLLPLALLALVAAYFRTAWISDDAFITFRVVDNLIGGHGLVWNVGERVQVFTHPLWLALIAAPVAVTGEPFFTTLALSFACLAVSAWLLLQICGSRAAAAAILFVLALSRVFVDYSSSGLENPLSHVLLLGLLLIQQRPETVSNVAWASLATALLIVNRLDLALIAAPIALDVAWRARHLGWGRVFIAALAGATPLVAWLGFALLYYGSLVPNTFFAKLSTGIAPGEYWSQGLAYYWNLLRFDPASAALIVAGLAAGAVLPRQRLVAAGLLLYLVYILKIGGDFMSGRFFSVAVVVAAVLAVRAAQALKLRPVIVALACTPFLFNAHRTVLSPWDFGFTVQTASGIVDERAFYFPHQGLWRNLGHPRIGEGPFAGSALFAEAHGSPAVLCNVGLPGFMVRDDVHIVDPYALTDPFLARLPVIRPWRIGHYERAIPPGYLETLESGENRIQDPALAQLWNDVAIVTRGPLLSPGRMQAMIRLNFGEGTQVAQRSDFARRAASFVKDSQWQCAAFPLILQRPRRGP